MSDAPAIPTPEQQEVFFRLAEIFTPHAMNQVLRLYPKKQGTAKFVHYTTADAALKIIDNRTLWMRNAVCMSDYSEMTHGYEMLRKQLLNDGAQHEELVAALPSAFRLMVNSGCMDAVGADCLPFAGRRVSIASLGHGEEDQLKQQFVAVLKTRAD